MNYIGKPIPREEDLRLLQGRGRYTQDVNALNQAQAYVLRSPAAHANIQSIKTTAIVYITERSCEGHLLRANCV